MPCAYYDSNSNSYRNKTSWGQCKVWSNNCCGHCGIRSNWNPGRVNAIAQDVAVSVVRRNGEEVRPYREKALCLITIVP